MRSKQKALQALTIISFENNGDRTDAVVCVCPSIASAMRITARQAKLMLVERPTLAQHACKQGGIGTFAEKIVGSTLPHLVEHLAIDLLVEEVRSQAETRLQPHEGWQEQTETQLRLCESSQAQAETQMKTRSQSDSRLRPEACSQAQPSSQLQPQVKTQLQPHASLAVSGNTRWLDKECGLAMVSIKCNIQNPKTVSHAITDAVARVNSLVEQPSN